MYVCTNVCIVCVHELELLCTYRCMYYACLGVCMSTYMYVLCVCVQVYVHMSSCIWLHGYSVLDSFVRSELSNRRFRFVPVMDSIHWQFEDRPMRWSRDQYQFVQWRPDGDSDSKTRHFMCVFVLMSFSYILLPVGVHVAIRIISCDRLIYFTSMITCIISCDVSECSFYL